MIALFFLVGIVVWLVVAIVLTAVIPSGLGNIWLRILVRLILFPILLVLPISDELIGRWQFQRLCAREAVVTLSPDWKNVRRAKQVNIQITPLFGYMIQIKEQDIEYMDIDTKKTFLKYKAFHTKGGFLMNDLGLGLDTSISCWPENSIGIHKKIKLSQLIKNGDKNE